MTDLQMWDLVVGFVSATLVLPVIQQPRWRQGTRALVTFLFCVVVGAVTAYLTGAFSSIHELRGAVSSVLMLLVTAIASYRGFAKPIGIAPAIEHATSPAPAPTNGV